MKKFGINDLQAILKEMLEKQSASPAQSDSDERSKKKQASKDDDKSKAREKEKDKDIRLKQQTKNYSIGEILSKDFVLMHMPDMNEYTVKMIDYTNKVVIATAAEVDENGQVVLDPMTQEPIVVEHSIPFDEISEYVVA